MDDELVTIDVCVATYRRPQLLEALLDSLLAQRTEGRFRFTINVVENDAARVAESVEGPVDATENAVGKSTENAVGKGGAPKGGSAVSATRREEASASDSTPANAAPREAPSPPKAATPAAEREDRDEGFDEIADWFETLAKAERSHANRFQKALDGLDG